MTKYNLELDDEQLQVIKDALEIYFRLGMGQIDTLDTHPSFIKSDYDRWEIRGLYDTIKSKVFPQLCGAYYGIRHEEVREECKIAHDMRDVIRHRLAWDKNHKGGWQNFYDEPFITSAKELPKLEKKY